MNNGYISCLHYLQTSTVLKGLCAFCEALGDRTGADCGNYKIDMFSLKQSSNRLVLKWIGVVKFSTLLVSNQGLAISFGGTSGKN